MPYYFRLPQLTQLTIPQQTALNEPGPIAISGGPGTGKSVVSLWRHIRNHSLGGMDSLLLTYTKTMMVYLASTAGEENKKAGKQVDRIFRWLQHGRKNYDEIIIDEAQDVAPHSHEQIKAYSDSICYGADDQQIIWPNRSSTQAQLATIYVDNLPCPLDENFRNTYEILLFVKSIFPDKRISQNTLRNLLTQNDRRGEKPRVIDTRFSRVKERNVIKEIIESLRSDAHNIAILVPLKRDVANYYNMLWEAGIECTSYDSDDASIDVIGNVHVTTFKSSKGTEFDTVILPDFHSMRANINSLYVVEENDYYVALTRARRNLFLICNYLPTFLGLSDAQKRTYTYNRL